jgi:hypothetical protein
MIDIQKTGLVAKIFIQKHVANRISRSDC